MGLFDWFSGNTIDTPSVAPKQEEPVFVGTTAELLAATNCEVCAPTPEPEPTPVVDPYMNLEVLKLAFQIEESASQAKVFYIDVGNLPRLKAEQYIKDQRAALTTNGKELPKDIEYFLPRRESGMGTEVVSIPGKVELEKVLDTAEKLKQFLTS